MASIYDLKPRFQRFLRPLVGGLARAGVTPNQVTTLAILLSCAAGACIARWPTQRLPLLVLPAVLLLRMALNAVDGMLAREHDMTSNLGAFLNELGDVASDAVLYLPLALVPGVPAFAIVAIVVLAALSEMAGVLGVLIGGRRRYDGPMGKSDRALVFGILGLLLGGGVAAGVWLPILLGAMSLLLALTVVNRARRGLREAA